MCKLITRTHGLKLCCKLLSAVLASGNRRARQVGAGAGGGEVGRWGGEERPRPTSSGPGPSTQPLAAAAHRDLRTALGLGVAGGRVAVASARHAACEVGSDSCDFHSCRYATRNAVQARAKGERVRTNACTNARLLCSLA